MSTEAQLQIHSKHLNFILKPFLAFISLQDTDCLYGSNLFIMSGDVATDHKPYKDWCESRNDCHGFTVDGYSTCFFKESGCKDKVYSCIRLLLYLKTNENTGT